MRTVCSVFFTFLSIFRKQIEFFLWWIFLNSIPMINVIGFRWSQQWYWEKTSSWFPIIRSWFPIIRKTRFQIAKVPFRGEKIQWKILLALKEFWKSPAKTAIHCEQWLGSECYIHQMLKSYSWYSKHKSCLSYKPNGWLWKPSMEKVKILNANRLYHFHKVKCVKRGRTKQISIKKSPAWNINWTIRSFF